MAEADLKCAFSGPQISGSFACSQGRQVVRRGGAEIACGSEQAQQRCTQLFESLKAGALAHMGMEDNLLTMPHSVLFKVQFGGLLALQKKLGDSDETVSDIDGLVMHLIEHYGDVEEIPCAAVAADIAAYEASRRRKRKK